MVYNYCRPIRMLLSPICDVLFMLVYVYYPVFCYYHNSGVQFDGNYFTQSTPVVWQPCLQGKRFL